MKAYVITTGALFVLLALAHVVRMFLEPALATAPWFIALTVAPAGLSLWAFCLLRPSGRRS